MALVPPGLYGSVSRKWLTTVVCGGLMLLVTAGSWFVVQVSKNDFVMGAPALGFVISLGIASWAVIDPFEHRES